MPQFENKSFEELRHEDYAQGTQGRTPRYVAVSHIVDPPPVPFGYPRGGWVPYNITTEGASFVFEWEYCLDDRHSRVVPPPLAANLGQAWKAYITTKGGRRVFELRTVDPNNAGP